MKEVIRFWFEELKPEDWFKKSEALDQEMRERFEELYWKASRGELFHWRATAEGRLAEILLLDQIPRNIFRGTAQAFATDSLALVLAQEGLTQAQELPVVQRGFFYMPFMPVSYTHLDVYKRQAPRKAPIISAIAIGKN